MLEMLLDRIQLLENKKEIMELANELLTIILNNKTLPDNDKLMTVDLLNALVNNQLYKQ